MRLYIYFIAILCLLSGIAAQAAPTFGDLAVWIAKGYFKGHVSQTASLEECVSFLNGHGVCFSLFDVMDPHVGVTKEAFARAVGQSTLLFMDEAELHEGSVKRPNEAKSWVDYCLLNDVSLIPLWEGFLRRTQKGMLPEVEKFFGRAL